MLEMGNREWEEILTEKGTGNRELLNGEDEPLRSSHPRDRGCA